MMTLGTSLDVLVGTGRFELPIPHTPSSLHASSDQNRRINRLEGNVLSKSAKASRQRQQRFFSSKPILGYMRISFTMSSM